MRNLFLKLSAVCSNGCYLLSNLGSCMVGEGCVHPSLPLISVCTFPLLLRRCIIVPVPPPSLILKVYVASLSCCISTVLMVMWHCASILLLCIWNLCVDAQHCMPNGRCYAAIYPCIQKYGGATGSAMCSTRWHPSRLPEAMWGGIIVGTSP